jgi:hypothetical protein
VLQGLSYNIFCEKLEVPSTILPQRFVKASLIEIGQIRAHDTNRRGLAKKGQNTKSRDKTTMRTYEIYLSLEVLYVRFSYCNVLVMLSMVLQFFFAIFCSSFFAAAVVFYGIVELPPVDCIPT